jgi:hypothetical protein
LIGILALGALLGAVLIYRQTRSRSSREPAPLRAWSPPKSGPDRRDSEAAPEPGSKGRSEETPEPTDDTEALYARLTEVRELIRKKRPPESE